MLLLVLQYVLSQVSLFSLWHNNYNIHILCNLTIHLLYMMLPYLELYTICDFLLLSHYNLHTSIYSQMLHLQFLLQQYMSVLFLIMAVLFLVPFYIFCILLIPNILLVNKLVFYLVQFLLHVPYQLLNYILCMHIHIQQECHLLDQYNYALVLELLFLVQNNNHNTYILYNHYILHFHMLLPFLELLLIDGFQFVSYIQNKSVYNHQPSMSVLRLSPALIHNLYKFLVQYMLHP